MKFDLTYILKEKIKGFCPTFIQSFEAADYPTALSYFDAIKSEGQRGELLGAVAFSFLHDDRGVLISRWVA